MRLVISKLQVYRWVLIVIEIILLFFSVALTLHSTGKLMWLVGVERILIQNEIIQPACLTKEGNCYSVKLNTLLSKKPISSLSLAQIYEDGKPIGPANAQITNIISIGAGRFFLSPTGKLYFSASDNGSPILNGRRYELVMPRLIVSNRWLEIIWISTAVTTLLLFASFYFSDRSLYSKDPNKIASKKITPIPHEKGIIPLISGIAIAASLALHLFDFWMYSWIIGFAMLIALSGVFSILFYYANDHFIPSRFCELSRGKKWISIIIIILVSIFFMTVFSVKIPFPDDAGLLNIVYPNGVNSISIETISLILNRISTFGSDAHTDVPFLILCFICIGIDVITMSILLFKVSFLQFNNTDQQGMSRWAFIYYALPMVVIWTIYLLTFFPGILSSDSINQWNQVLTTKFNDYHPVFHTLNIWILSRIWLTPAVMIIVQLTALALVIGWGLQSFRQLGSPLWSVWLISILCALCPINGIMAITLWKDIPYTIAILGLSIILLKIISTNGKWLCSYRSSVILGIVAALIPLYRHEGIVISIIIIPLLYILYLPYWQKITISLLVALVIFGTIKGPLYEVLKVQRSTVSDKTFMTKQLYFIAAHISAGTPVTPDEMNMLNKIRPTDNGWNIYDCTTVKTVIYGLNWSIADSYKEQINQLFWKLTLSNPSVDINHILCYTTIIWRIQPTEDGRFAYPMYNPEDINTRLQDQSLLPMLQYSLARYTQMFNDIFSILGRPSFQLYLLIIATCIASIRNKNAKYMLLVLP
ncbi:MAG: hypothetical protein WCI88_15715, partial [Chloroflexota bacterium]